ncbi:MAG: TRAP transporter small permease [Deltaproteobacteria bacterium HGW-Deltaproteobacteria-15]|jgi:TRAP-type C4-dicarboxylate transport system permease small subunit|nr:MAG: TRAP transporter small permease [Deltaproteobacteria bacterium HGW-Deltaproteobacteria-15]
MTIPGAGMGWLLKAVFTMSKGLNKIAEIALACMILLTVFDVILRTGRAPIIGTYEMVGLLGAIIISFAIPFTSWIKAHIRVDFAILRLSPRARAIVDVITRCVGLALFLAIGWHLLILGAEALKAGEVTPTRHIPLYPVIYAVGAASFFQSLVLFCDILKIFRGEYE